MEMETLLDGNSGVALVKIGVCYMLQSVVAETALIALTSRLLFLFKTSPLLDANILADLTGIDNRFPSEKVAAENMDGGDAEDTESEDDEDEDDDDDDDDDDGEDGSEDDDDSDSDAETSGDGGSDEDDDNDSDEDDEDDSDDESDEDDEESDEEDDKKMQAQPPSEKKK
ncbi:hypothetical protein OIU77_023864 [Salix suchowensis]|uniref:Uncharacterized protein n=1 Tax=Salix suchowensis TaxID=1278906 RepID=A0ABQ9C936_9ROSI|nr:hypothetical protein OIU77_023864 [Salix suchowensis]